MEEERGLRLGTFAGAAVVVQPAFLLLALYIVATAVLTGGVAAAGGALVFVVIIFAAVLIHEFGHAAAAAALNIPSKRIVLTFFGGYVQFARAPEKRWHEMAVSAAGPAANLICLPLALYAAGALAQSNYMLAAQLENFASVSALLGFFNLAPGLPLDGGHVLRAGLAYVMPARRAGMIAAGAGVVLAVALIAFAFWQNLLWSAFIGGLIALAAWTELQRYRAAPE